MIARPDFKSRSCARESAANVILRNWRLEDPRGWQPGVHGPDASAGDTRRLGSGRGFFQRSSYARHWLVKGTPITEAALDKSGVKPLLRSGR